MKKLILSTFILCTMLFNQIAMSQSFEQSFETDISQANILNEVVDSKEQIDSKIINNSIIEFQISDSHFLNKLLNKLPKDKKTLLTKFLSLNENQIEGIYSYDAKSIKIKSTQENYGEIINYLKAKNITFSDDVCSDLINVNCRVTSNQDFKGYKISIEDQAIYIHKKPLNKNILDLEFELSDDVMIKANVSLEQNPFEIKLTNKDSKFEFEYTIELENEDFINSLKEKNTTYDFYEYINSNTLAFLENKGLDKANTDKLNFKIRKMLKELCYLTEQECNDAEESIKLNGNIYNLSEDSKLYNLITQKDSAILLNISEDLSINYSYIFKDSLDEKEALANELEQYIEDLEYKKENGIYEISADVNTVSKAISGITYNQEPTAIQLFPENKDSLDGKVKTSYLKIENIDKNLHVSLSANKNYQIEKIQNSENKLDLSGLNYFELNANAYIETANQNPEKADPMFTLFGSFLKDIKINGESNIINNKLISKNKIEIPESTLNLLLGFVSPTQTLKDQNYNDIKEEDWFSKPIKELDEEIFISSILETQYDQETFKANFLPNKDISRKEFIMLITELLFKDEIAELKTKHEQQLKDNEERIETLSVIGKEDMFSDFQDYLAKGFYHVQLAKQIGLVKGDEGKNTLRPDDSLSRAEAVTLLARSFDSLKNTKADELEIEFTDVPQDAWYMQNLKKAVKNQIVKGTSSTTFSPTDKLNRAQAVTLINRLNKQILKFY